MPFDSAGVFTRPANSFSNPVNGTIIDPADATTTFNDWDTALTRSALRIVTAAGAITVSNTEGGIAVNKTVGAATAIALPVSSLRGGLPVIVKDMKGDANTNNITVTPNVGDTLGIDGNATDVITINKDHRTYTPIPGGWLKT